MQRLHQRCRIEGAISTAAHYGPFLKRHSPKGVLFLEAFAARTVDTEQPAFA